MNLKHLEFHRDEAVVSGLARIVGALAADASARIKHPSRELGADLHDVRVTTKCLRAIMRLARPHLNDGFYQRQNGRLRDAAKGLAAYRDDAVARITFEKILAKLAVGRDRAAFEKARAGFGVAAEAAPESGAERGSNWLNALAAFDATKHDFQSLRMRDRGWKTIEPGLEETYRQNRYWMEQAFATGNNAVFHEWRKRAKYLFYQTRMLLPLNPERLEKLERRLDRLQNALGKNHDLLVLKQFLLRDPAAFGGHVAVRRILRHLEQRSRKLKSKSLALGGKAFAAKPARFTRDLRKRWKLWKKSPATPSHLTGDEN